MKWPISTPSTSNRNVAAVTRSASKLSSGIEHRLPRAFVHVGHQADQSSPVGVVEIEQPIEIPVEVVRQVGDLAPQRRFSGRASRSVSHRSLRRGARDFLDPRPAPRRAGTAVADCVPSASESATSVRVSCSSSSGSLSLDAPGPSPPSNDSDSVEGRTLACRASTSAWSPKLMIPYRSCRNARSAANKPFDLVDVDLVATMPSG